MISVLYLLRGAAMPNARTRVRFRLEESVKKQAETIFARHGLTLAEAFRLFTEEAGHIGGLSLATHICDMPKQNPVSAQ